MEKMLIVDDNKRERDGVAGIIDWNKYGIEIVALCSNGQQALDYAKANPVDIILSDVEMPILNGISLLKALREADNDVKFIFMSCYDEFDFVKSAMDLGATGYILKPITVEELEKMIEKVLKLQKSEAQLAERERIFEEILARNSKVLLENFFRQMLFNFREDTAAIRRESDLLKIPDKFAFSRVVLIKIQPDENESTDHMIFISALVEKIAMLSEERIYVQPVIVSYNKVAEIVLYNGDGRDRVLDISIDLKEYSSSTLGIKTSFGISNESDKGITDLSNLYKQAELAADTFFVSDDDNIILYNEVAENSGLSFGIVDMAELQREVNTIIAKCDIAMAKDMINRYLSNADMVSNKNYVRYFLYTLLNVIEIALVNTSINTDSVIGYSKIWSKLAQIETILNIPLWLENVFKSIFEAIDALRQSKGQNMVNGVKDIIHSEYGSHLTITYIADKLHFSGVHINNIFKQETGEAIFDYLTRYRMEKAKEFLKQSDSKVYVVAKSVGYTNRTHFKMLFSQYVGMTPLEYKNICIGGADKTE